MFLDQGRRPYIALLDEDGIDVTFARDPMDGLFLLSAALRIHLPGVPYTKMVQHGINNAATLATYS